jgi:prevent-host-death family protein
MREIKAGEFKAKCLKLLDEVAETGEGLVVTKRGRPVARVLPEQAKAGPLLGCLKDLIEIVDPDDDLEAWDNAMALGMEARLDRLARELSGPTRRRRRNG